MQAARSKLMPIEQALVFLLKQLDSKIPVNSEIQELPLSEALGGILAEAEIAQINVPGYDNSAMDGYAVNSKDLRLGELTLPISQVIAAGHIGARLKAGTAARIFTGAAIPSGADIVIIQENARQNADAVTFTGLTDIEQMIGQNIRLEGHDIEKGTQVLSSGHRLRAQDLGLLSSLGIPQVKVKRRLRVAIINTGDEIVSPDTQLGPGQIYDSNSYTLAGLLQGLGFETIKLGIVADDLNDTKAALKEAAEVADCILTTGGVSVGDEDHVKAAVASLGELSLWKLAIKPGKPFSYGIVDGKPFFGLPGNPVAVFVTFSMLVRPFLLKMQGVSPRANEGLNIQSGFDYGGSDSRQEYIRVRLRENSSGEQELVEFSNQGSSIMTSLSWADGLAVIPIGGPIAKGDKLKFFPFSELS